MKKLVLALLLLVGCKKEEQYIQEATYRIKIIREPQYGYCFAIYLGHPTSIVHVPCPDGFVNAN